MEMTAQDPASFVVVCTVVSSMKVTAFQGRFTQCGSDDVKVNVTYKSGQFWKRPSHTDELFTPGKKSRKLLSLPKLQDQGDNVCLIVLFLLSTRYMHFQWALCTPHYLIINLYTPCIFMLI